MDSIRESRITETGWAIDRIKLRLVEAEHAAKAGRWADVRERLFEISAEIDRREYQLTRYMKDEYQKDES